jgi:hypothetical protein
MTLALMILATVAALPDQVIEPAGPVTALSPRPPLRLPANADVAVTPTEDLTSKGIKVGHLVPIVTVFDVMANGYVIVPKGTPGQAQVTWRKGKSSFGTSAKMDLSFQWLDLNGRKIGLTGTYRQEGEGGLNNAIGAWAVGTVIAGALVTGKSAKVGHGALLIARTAEDLTFVAPSEAVVAPK